MRIVVLVWTEQQANVALVLPGNTYREQLLTPVQIVMQQYVENAVDQVGNSVQELHAGQVM